MGIIPRWDGMRPTWNDSTTIERSGSPVDFNDWVATIAGFGGAYPLGLNMTMSTTKAEEFADSFAGYVRAAYRSNGIVYACMAARMAFFQQARFQFRRFESGRPGDLFGGLELGILENPWPNGSTSDLLARMEQDESVAGNFYAWRSGDELYHMRPDWTSIVIGSNMEPDDPKVALDARVLGYGYHPGGYNSGKAPIPLPYEEVVHYAPRPDPEAKFLGMSWLTSILTEIQGDNVATSHKVRFFEGGATPNQAIIVPIADPAEFQEFVQMFKNSSRDPQNAYKHLFLNQGFDTRSIGTDLQQVDFATVQGAGETRICAAAEVPPIIVGTSEGLKAATYSNYGLALRRWADISIRPRWQNAAKSLSNVLTMQSGTELSYDDRDIPALREDVQAAATARQSDASTIRTFIDAGFEPDSAVESVNAGDLNKLVHTGLVSVQLQEPGAEESEPSANGDGDLAEQASRILEEATA